MTADQIAESIRKRIALMQDVLAALEGGQS